MKNKVLLSVVILFLIAVTGTGILNTPRVSALPAGFHEFYIPLTANVSQGIFVDIDDDPSVSENMHFVIGVTASADNTVIYYDHWENGLLTGTGSDENVPLSKGEVHVFESSDIPTNPRGNSTKYDGGDRVYVSGSLLQLVVSIWPEDPGTVFCDAWEIYPVQAWESTYTVPVGEDLAGAPWDYSDFSQVFVLVMSGTDNNSITIVDPNTGTHNFTLDRGQSANVSHIYAGTTVTADDPVEVQLMTGRDRSGSASEMRGYTIVPQTYWETSYYAPVPSWSSGNSDLFLYNPNAYQITINYEDLSGSGSFTISANGTKSYYDGTGRYVPENSGACVASDDVFWGIASSDTGSAIWDWGYDLVPASFLGTDNYISWAPGTAGTPPLDNNGSPVYVMAVNDDTTVFVDYGPNDGTINDTYTLDSLEVVQIYDPDNDNTGMHIVSDDLVAIAWGESPDTASMGSPYLDVGYTTLPLPDDWIDIALAVEKTAACPTEAQVGEEVEFTIVTTVPGTYPQNVTEIDLVDTLPPGWQYVAGSSSDPPGEPTITGNLTSGYVLTWDANWDISPGSSETVVFRAEPTASADKVNPNRNVAEATGTTQGVLLTADDHAFCDVGEYEKQDPEKQVPVGGIVEPVDQLELGATYGEPSDGTTITTCIAAGIGMAALLAAFLIWSVRRRSHSTGKSQ